MQEMKDYLHISSSMSVAGERDRHSGIKVTSLRVTFVMYIYTYESDSRWVTREIVTFLWGEVTEGHGEVMQGHHKRYSCVFA